jgi:hypothetical protein
MPWIFGFELGQAQPLPKCSRALHELPFWQSHWRERGLQGCVDEDRRKLAIVTRIAWPVRRLLAIAELEIVLRLAAVGH